MNLRWRVTAAAFVLFLAAGAAQYGLATWLGSATTFSRDAVTALSFGIEALGFLMAGFLLSFLGRGYRPVANAIASIVFGMVTFFVLRQLKPPSFSYDRFFASTGELVVWSLCAALGSWLLAMWGASLGMLIGAAGHLDGRFQYEWGIARTHLRLNCRTATVILLFVLIPPGVILLLGQIAADFDKLRRAGGHLTLRLALMLGAIVVVGLALAGRAVLARSALARLQPGQRRKRPATVVMTGISIAGVAVGVWALTVVLSVMSGFEADLKHKILGTNSHALLLKFSNDFSEWKTVLPKVEAVPGVAGVSPFILNEVILSHGQTVTGAELKGIDPATAGAVSELPRQVIAGELGWITSPQSIPSSVVEPHGDAAKQLEGPEYEQYLQDTLKRRQEHPEEKGKMDPEAVKNLPGVCIGKEMSHQLRAWVGDIVNVLTPLGEMTPTGPVPRSRPFRVACILYSGMYEYDSKFVYIGIPEAQRFFKMGENIVGLELKFNDVDAARALGRRVVAMLGGFPYRTKDWAELNRNLFSALKLEKLAMAIILTFIVLVACFNILSTLIMLVLEKTKEISILKSMGARDASVMKIFVVEGLTIGAIGTGMGLLMGLATCSFIEKFGLQLDPDVYYISNLPVNVDGAQFAMVAAISLCLSYLATLYPATKASRLSPVDGLREE